MPRSPALGKHGLRARGTRVKQARENRGLTTPEAFISVTPDFGPTHKAVPGAKVVTADEAAWVALLGAVNSAAGGGSGGPGLQVEQLAFDRGEERFGQGQPQHWPVRPWDWVIS